MLKCFFSDRCNILKGSFLVAFIYMCVPPCVLTRYTTINFTFLLVNTEPVQDNNDDDHCHNCNYPTNNSTNNPYCTSTTTVTTTDTSCWKILYFNNTHCKGYSMNCYRCILKLVNLNNLWSPLLIHNFFSPRLLRATFFLTVWLFLNGSCLWPKRFCKASL